MSRRPAAEVPEEDTPPAPSRPAKSRPAPEVDETEMQEASAAASVAAEETPVAASVPIMPPAEVMSGGSSYALLQGKRIGIIGAGAMGSALCRGLIDARVVEATKVVVSDIHSEHVQTLQQTLGVRVAKTNEQLAKHCEVVILAVKPFTVASVLDEIKDALHRDEGKPLPLFISIAAGVRIQTVQEHIDAPIPIIRAMPNTPAQVGMGACAYSRGVYAEDVHTEQARAIFESVGTALEVPEHQLDAVTALSGSGPAYVYLMIEALVDGGVKVGLPRDVASHLAAQTVFGAAKMVMETGKHPAQLKDLVTTPAGTTIAALASLEHSGVRAALIDAVEAATKRARELG
jgi:pyrroline-5-carboxylate reductase